jgi:hypothetical protein
MSVSEIRDHHSSTQAAPGFHFVHPGYKLLNTALHHPERLRCATSLQGVSKIVVVARFRARVLPTEAWRTARSPDERQRNPGSAFNSQAVPGFHGACHRAGRFGLQKKGRRNAGRRNPSIGRICECGARPPGRARLWAFHRGSCLGDPTPPLSSGYALPGTQPRRVLPAFRLSQSRVTSNRSQRDELSSYLRDNGLSFRHSVSSPGAPASHFCLPARPLFRVNFAGLWHNSPGKTLAAF